MSVLLTELPSLRFSGPSAGSLSCSLRAASKLAALTQSMLLFPQLRRGFQRLRTRLPLRYTSSRCVRRGLRGLAERNMDGAAGNPPRSAPHESRSPPTANLRSGRFVRALARWVAAGVPWSEGSRRSPKQQRYRMCNHHLFLSDTVKETSRTTGFYIEPISG